LGKGIYKAVDSKPKEDLNPDDFRVHPVLKAKALEILENNRNS